MSLEEMKKYVIQTTPEEWFRDVKVKEGVKSPIDLNEVPDEYNFQQAHPECLLPVRDQGKCGSCWAFSASEVMEDRYCAENGNITRLSPQDFVSCDNHDHGCKGGNFDSSMSYAHQEGIVVDKCLPYTSAGGSVAPCPYSCQDHSNWNASKYFVEDYDHIEGETEATGVLYSGGSIQGGMRVYSDLMSYTSGVYKWNKQSSYLGMHAIKIVGWGIYKTPYESTKYWIVQNSWGGTWGIKGYFWLAKDKGECWIAMYLYAPTKVTHGK